MVCVDQFTVIGPSSVDSVAARASCYHGTSNECLQGPVVAMESHLYAYNVYTFGLTRSTLARHHLRL